MKNCVLSIEALTERFRNLSDAARDLDDRDRHQTDVSIEIQIGLLMDIADSGVWSCETDFDDEKAIERLRSYCTSASSAWSYLRSGAPGVQRKMKVPSAEDRAFIVKRYNLNTRYNSAHCGIRCSRAEDLSEDGHRRILEHLLVPGDAYAIPLYLVIPRCKDLAQARRVLKAVGLTPTRIECDGEQVLRLAECPGDEVYFHPALNLKTLPQ